MSKIRITNFNGEAIKGCFVLEYRGFEISISTIPSTPEMRIYGGNRHPGRDMTESITGSDMSILPTIQEITLVKSLIDKYIEG